MTESEADLTTQDEYETIRDAAAESGRSGSKWQAVASGIRWAAEGHEGDIESALESVDVDREELAVSVE